MSLVEGTFTGLVSFVRIRDTFTTFPTVLFDLVDRFYSDECT
jgi:hypothetical protein